MRAHMASRIELVMREYPLSGERFAEAMGLTKAAASKWSKTGKITHHNLYKLARLTKRPIGWFYPDFDSPEESRSMRGVLEAGAGDASLLEEALLEVLLARKRASNLE